MRVLSVLHRTTTGEVLCCCNDRVRSNLLTLEALDVLDKQSTCQVGVLTQGTTNSTPSRLSREIHLRMKSLADSHGNVLLAGNLSKGASQLRGPQGSNAKGLGPSREAVGNN